MDQQSEFERFFRDVEPRLRRAFVGSYGIDRAGDAAAEALGWAWENWEMVQAMDNPAGYLFRVGQSKTRPPKRLRLPAPVALQVPEVEPGLVSALTGLSPAQRTAVWLVHGCHWQYAEVAEAMGSSASAVGTHVSRGLINLRLALGVTNDS